MGESAKTVFITGAGRGLGLALAGRFLQAGWRTIVTCRGPKPPAPLSALLEQYPKRTLLLDLDLRDEHAIAGTAGRLHGEPVDVLINNAGTLGGPAAEQEFACGGASDGWRDAFAVNAMAPHRLVETLIDNLRKGRRKTVINISSIVASLAEPPIGGLYEYRSSKAALNAVTVGQSMDLRARGIIVVAVHPGILKTAMGGDYATRLPEETAVDILALADRLTLDDSGKFLDFNGHRLAW